MRQELDTAPNLGEDTRSGGAIDHVVRSGNLPAIEPNNWFIDKKGTGLVFRVVNRGRLYSEGRLSGAVIYNVHWAELVDESTATGIEAGFRRSKVIASVPGLSIEGMESESPLMDNADYQTGWFYLIGVSSTGEPSDFGTPKHIANAVQSREVPENVSHLQGTESGEVHDGTVYSKLSFSMVMPRYAAGVQIVLEHYPNMNEVTEWVTKQYNGGALGSLQFEELAQVCRRRGDGVVDFTAGVDIVTGTGTQFTLLARAGDFFEAAGARAEILGVADDALTLAANWSARDGSSVSDWQIIGKVRAYARTLSDGGALQNDLSLLPYVDLVLDGELSAPNAPEIVGVSAGNVNRITFEQVLGTEIHGYNLYSKRGVDMAFDECIVIDHIPQPTMTTSTALSTMQFEDSNFTAYERETGAPITYYVTTVNVRGDESLPSNVVTIFCSLDAPSDNGPQNTARDHPKNLLWGATLCGTGTVVVGDATQDTDMGTLAMYPGFASLPPSGFSRWRQSPLVPALGGSAPSFANGREIELAMTVLGGAGNSIVDEVIGAWGNATPGARRIPVGKYLTIQTKVRTSGGLVSGSLIVGIRQLDAAGAVLVGASPKLRTRDAVTDEIVWSASDILIAGSDIEEDHALVWGVFQPDWSVSTASIAVLIGYSDSAWGGVNIFVTEPMVSLGDALPTWTAELVDVRVTYPAPTGGAPIPPGRFPDREARDERYSRITP